MWSLNIFLTNKLHWKNFCMYWTVKSCFWNLQGRQMLVWEEFEKWIKMKCIVFDIVSEKTFSSSYLEFRKGFQESGFLCNHRGRGGGGRGGRGCKQNPAWINNKRNCFWQSESPTSFHVLVFQHPKQTLQRKPSLFPAKNVTKKTQLA